MTERVAELVTKMAESVTLYHSTLNHQNEKYIDGLMKKSYTNPLEPPNCNGNQLLHNVAKEMKELKACPGCRHQVYRILLAGTTTRLPKKRQAKKMSQHKEQAEKRARREDDGERSQETERSETDPDTEDEHPEERKEKINNKLTEIRADIAHNLSMTVRSVMTGCMWNILHLSHSERRKLNKVTATMECAGPLQANSDFLRRMDDQANQGLSKSGKNW